MGAANAPFPRTREFSAMLRFALGLAVVTLMASAAMAMEPAKTMDTSLGKVGTGADGMTVYAFDTETKCAAMSAWVDQCIENWPPRFAAEGAMAEGEWTRVDVKDKDGAMKKMWAYEGWPLYLWVKDTKPGDVTG